MRRYIKQWIALFYRRRAEKYARSVFVPTGAIQLLHAINLHFPQHLFLAGDFSFLPFGDVSKTLKNLRTPGTLFGCKNAPIISGNDAASGYRIDYPTYIVPDQTFDVFFQTDFLALAGAYQGIVKGGSSRVERSQQFLESNSSMEDRQHTTTKSGYNPMLEDFENVSFLLGTRSIQSK